MLGSLALEACRRKPLETALHALQEALSKRQLYKRAGSLRNYSVKQTVFPPDRQRALKGTCMPSATAVSLISRLVSRGTTLSHSSPVVQFFKGILKQTGTKRQKDIEKMILF